MILLDVFENKKAEWRTFIYEIRTNQLNMQHTDEGILKTRNCWIIQYVHETIKYWKSFQHKLRNWIHVYRGTLLGYLIDNEWLYFDSTWHFHWGFIFDWPKPVIAIRLIKTIIWSPNQQGFMQICNFLSYWFQSKSSFVVSWNVSSNILSFLRVAFSATTTTTKCLLN